MLSLLSDWNDADDVLQQVSLILWRKFDAPEVHLELGNRAGGIAADF